jgi:O-antigen/teichoic acid export membrane protein
VGSISSRALALIAAILAARILGKASYGEMGVIQSTIGMFGTLAGFGMGTTATKFVAEFRVNDPARAGRIIGLSSLVSWGMSGLLAIVLIAISPWLCQRTLAAPQLTGCLKVSALLLLLNGVNGAQNGVLSGFEAFKRIARINLISGLLNFPAVIGGAFFFGLSGMIWVMILAQAAGCLLNYYALRRVAAQNGVAISYASVGTEASVIWNFSIPAVLGSLLIAPVTWACASMLVRKNDGLNQMGAYNAANQWFNALMWLPYMLGGVTLPMLAERFGAGDECAHGRVSARNRVGRRRRSRGPAPRSASRTFRGRFA